MEWFTADFHLSHKNIIHYCSTSGNYINVPPKVVKNRYVDKDKNYEIYIIENNAKHDIQVKNKLELQQFLKYLKNYIPFNSSIAKAGSSYRITISSFTIENKYFDPDSAQGKDFWIYFVEDV